MNEKKMEKINKVKQLDELIFPKYFGSIINDRDSRSCNYQRVTNPW